RGSRKPERPLRVRQVFRVIKVARRTREIEHELVRWKCNDVVGCLIVVEIVVVVLHEEYWSRAAQCSVLRHDLRATRAQEGGLIARAEYRLCSIERAGVGDALRGCATALGGLWRPQIPSRASTVCFAQRARRNPCYRDPAGQRDEFAAPHVRSLRSRSYST